MNARTKKIVGEASVATAAAATVEAPKTLEERFPSDEQLRKDGYVSLSARIRKYKVLGAETAEIAKLARRENGEHPRYQHVRNVLNQPLKRPTVEATNESTEASN